MIGLGLVAIALSIVLVPFLWLAAKATGKAMGDVQSAEIYCVIALLGVGAVIVGTFMRAAWVALAQ